MDTTGVDGGHRDTVVVQTTESAATGNNSNSSNNSLAVSELTTTVNGIPNPVQNMGAQEEKLLLTENAGRKEFLMFSESANRRYLRIGNYRVVDYVHSAYYKPMAFAYQQKHPGGQAPALNTLSFEESMNLLGEIFKFTRTTELIEEIGKFKFPDEKSFNPLSFGVALFQLEELIRLGKSVIKTAVEKKVLHNTILNQVIPSQIASEVRNEITDLGAIELGELFAKMTDKSSLVYEARGSLLAIEDRQTILMGGLVSDANVGEKRKGQVFSLIDGGSNESNEHKVVDNHKSSKKPDGNKPKHKHEHKSKRKNHDHNHHHQRNRDRNSRYSNKSDHNSNQYKHNDTSYYRKSDYGHTEKKYKRDSSIFNNTQSYNDKLYAAAFGKVTMDRDVELVKCDNCNHWFAGIAIHRSCDCPFKAGYGGKPTPLTEEMWRRIYKGER
jgi:hypothetical protein